MGNGGKEQFVGWIVERRRKPRAKPATHAETGVKGQGEWGCGRWPLVGMLAMLECFFFLP